MTALKWTRLSALDGARVVHNGTANGIMVAQVAEAEAGYSVWISLTANSGYRGKFKTIGEAKAHAEKLLGVKAEVQP